MSESPASRNENHSSKDQTTQRHKAGDNRSLKSTIALRLRLIAAYGTMATLIAGGLLSYHYTVPGVALGAIAISCALLDGFLFYQHYHKRSRKRFVFAYAAFLIINGACIASSFFPIYDFYSVQDERFHVVLNNIQVASIPLKPTVVLPFFTFATYDYLKAARHPQLLVNLTIENEQQVNSTLLSYSISSAEQAEGPWSHLCPVDLEGMDFYYESMNLLDASPMETTNFLDKLLPGKLIHPQDPISGWTSWECDGTCSTKFLKITLNEANGRSSSQILSTAIYRTDQAGISPTIYVHPVDVKIGVGGLGIARNAFARGCNSDLSDASSAPSVNMISGGRLTITSVRNL